MYGDRDRGKNMKHQPLEQRHYGRVVWINAVMDELRKDECLCRNCGNADCLISKVLFEICKGYGMALAVTRCERWEPEIEIREMNGDA